VVVETHLIRIEGKDLTSVTGSVKGTLQSYVRNTHKYDGAEIDLHRREGTILVKGVPRTVLEEGMRFTQSKLLPDKRFTYSVEAVSAPHPSEPDHEAAEARIETRYVKMMEVQRKEWEQQVAGYEGELRRLTGEADDLRRKLTTVNELRRQDQDQAASLKKSYDELSRLLERVTGERARSPLEMADAWVGDWSVTARQLDQKLAEAVGDEWPAVDSLLQFDPAALRGAVEGEGVLETVPDDVGELERLVNAPPWEDTEESGALGPAYEKAKVERDYIEALDAGTVQMPEALRQTLLGAVDRSSLDTAIRAYEDAKTAHSNRTAASNRIQELVQRFRRAESLRALLGGKERTIPVAVVCRDAEDGYRIESIFPRSDGVTLRASLDEVAREAIAEAAERSPDLVAEEAIVRVGAQMSGKYKEWKDTSRQEERACLVLGRAFKNTPLYTLGFRLNVIKVMVGPHI